MLERDLQRKISRKLKSLGWMCYKFSSPGHNGVPDLICIKDGKTLFLEVKTPTGRLSKLQAHTHSLMRDHGANVYVVKTVEDAVNRCAECSDR